MPKRSIIDRLSDKLMEMPNGCWEYTGAKVGRGYGTISTEWGKPNAYVHRVAYESHYGPIPKGMLVCHTCDNPPCCNPEHLFLGTAKDNTQDMIVKGRHGGGYKGKLNTKEIEQATELILSNGLTLEEIANRFNVGVAVIDNLTDKIKKARGIKRRGYLLNKEKAEQIRALVAEGLLPKCEIAIRFKIHPSMLTRIIKGERWS